ncbi:MAG: hypothetical protein ABIN01_13900 [Ferruginibacter sp.]
MEVHQHSSHTAGNQQSAVRKKWTHYFWEFLMLFLAVFCGFIAENIREHQVEHTREKEYMKSLLSDIAEDTVEMNKSLVMAKEAIQYEDSAILYIYQHPPDKYLPENFTDMDTKALRRLKVVFNNITAQQLKNAGNLRLLRSQETIKKISVYWNKQENTIITLDRYLDYRNRGREFAEKLFAYSERELADAKMIPPISSGTRVIISDPALWSEYSNILSHCRVTAKIYLEELTTQRKLAVDLIKTLKKEYNF